MESGVSNPPPQSAVQLMQQQQQQRALPPVPLIDPTHITNDSSTASSNSNSSNNNTSSSNSSSTCSSNNCSPNHQSLPNTPQHVMAAAASVNAGGGCGSVRYRDKGAKEKRHSLNALLQSAPLSLLQTNRHSAEILSLPHELSRLELNTLANSPTTAMTVTQSSQTSRVLKHQQQLPPTLPWGYLALFPYKPSHSDELELKKGCVYIVTERCVDGWFKGKNWLDITGVFPGNYLTPLRTRDQQQLMHQWKYVPPYTDMTSTPAQSIDVRLSNMLPTQPPDLPPRQQQQPQTTTSSSVWTKPVEALFSRKSSGNVESKPDASGSSSGAVGLMRRLTHMKTRSKSPGAPLQQQQQPQAASKEAQINTSSVPLESIVKAAPLHPVHVR